MSEYDDWCLNTICNWKEKIQKWQKNIILIRLFVENSN